MRIALAIPLVLLIHADSVLSCFRTLPCASCSASTPVIKARVETNLPLVPLTTTSGTDANGCLTKTFSCTGKTSTNIEFNETPIKFLNGSPRTTRVEFSDCSLQTTNPCTVTLVCDDTGQWSYQSTQTGVTFSDITQITCVEFTP